MRSVCGKGAHSTSLRCCLKTFLKCTPENMSCEVLTTLVPTHGCLGSDAKPCPSLPPTVDSVEPAREVSITATVRPGHLTWVFPCIIPQQVACPRPCLTPRPVAHVCICTLRGRAQSIASNRWERYRSLILSPFFTKPTLRKKKNTRAGKVGDCDTHNNKQPNAPAPKD